MTRRSRRPLRSDLEVHEKTTKDEGELLENSDRTTKDWCKVLNQNSFVPSIEQSIFRLDHMLFGDVNMTTTERYKFRSGNMVKDEMATSKHSCSTDKARARKEDLEANGSDFKSNPFTCGVGGGKNKDNSSYHCYSSRRSSLNLAMTRKTSDSREKGNLSTVENLYMELQNGESSGERFVDPPSITQKNGKCSSRLLDSDRKVEALCKAIQEKSIRNNHHELESYINNEEDTFSKGNVRSTVTRSYPRRNGICYRKRGDSEGKEEIQENSHNSAVLCFVDETTVNQNCVSSEVECQGTNDSPVTTAEEEKSSEISQPEVKPELSLPPKRQRRPPQSYSPSSSYDYCRLRKSSFGSSFRKRNIPARTLDFSESEERKELVESSETNGCKKKGQDKKKEKVKPETHLPVGQSCVENVSYVLGVRRLYHKNTSQVSQALVQFKDGTSNWVPSTMLNSLHSSLGEFFTDPHQKLHVLNRLPYNMQLTPALQVKESKIERAKPQTEGPSDTCPSITETSKPAKKKTVKEDVNVAKIDIGDSETHQVSSSLPVERNGVIAETTRLGQVPTTSVDPSHFCPTGLITSTDPLHSGILNNILGNVKRKSTSKATPKEIEVTKHDTFVHIIVRCKHTSHRNKRINPEICDKLVEHLEHYSVDDSVKLVVISGLEDHFSTKMDLLDVSRLPSWMEGHECKHSVLKLRYLFQTVRYYCKPLIGVINHPSRGLSASFLSLFDMVFDKERGVEMFAPSNSKARELSVLFPRVMGLAAKSEQLLMGELVEPSLEERLSQTEVAFRGTKYTYNLTETMKDVKGNLRKRHFATSDSPKNSSHRSSLSQETSPSPNLPIHKKRLIETDLIKKQIEREKELAQSCLQDISMFWNQVRNREIDEVLS